MGAGRLTAQLTILLESMPAYTPTEDSIFLTGDFNQWQPGERAFQLEPLGDGRYAYTFSVLPAAFEYKFTRGDWLRVESDALGQTLDNRRYVPEQDHDTLRVQVSGWEDLQDAIPYRSELTIVLQDLPENTPPEASIYLVGNFNNWHPGDPAYKMQPNAAGQYQAKVKLRRDTLLYKFTRGNWDTAEGDAAGRALPNRQYRADATTPPQVQIECRIQSWEDISGRPLTVYTFLLLLAAFQGILLVIAINTTQNYNRAANRMLSILIALTAVAIIGRVSTYDRETFQWMPKLLLLPDLIYFLFAPLFLFYMQKLLLLPSRNQRWRWLHFVPVILQFFAYLPLLLLDNEIFIGRVVDRSLSTFFAVSGGLALIYNSIYWWQSYRLAHAYEANNNANYSFEQNLKFLNTIILLIASCLFVWFLTYLVGIAGLIMGHDWQWLTNKTTDSVWALFALLIFCLGYFAMKQPEIFKVPAEVIDAEVQAQTKPTHTDNGTVSEEESATLQALKTQLVTIMQDEQPFLNPKLSLSELAETVGTNPHTLSKVINDGFDKNFYDFVNSWRVEAFKERVMQEAYRNHTFLAIAFSVGFNSKTAFNRAFKKLTNSTPGQYFKAQEMDDRQ